MNKNYQKTVFTVEMIIRKAKSGLVWLDHPIKKESRKWSNLMKSNLISDILQENPIPDLVFVEGKTGGVICVDGKQRFISVESFLNNEYRIDYNIDQYMLEYAVPVLDEDGIQMRDGNGVVIYKKYEYDIRMKKFKDLPKELRERILDYHFDVTIIDCCSEEGIIYHMKRFNSNRYINVEDAQSNIEQELEKFKKENELLRKKLETLAGKYSGLGRKEKFNDDEKKKIMDLRSKGYSIDKIKDEMQCSKGLVHKIIKEYSSN